MANASPSQNVFRLQRSPEVSILRPASGHQPLSLYPTFRDHQPHLSSNARWPQILMNSTTRPCRRSMKTLSENCPNTERVFQLKVSHLSTGILRRFKSRVQTRLPQGRGQGPPAFFGQKLFPSTTFSISISNAMPLFYAMLTF